MPCEGRIFYGASPIRSRTLSIFCCLATGPSFHRVFVSHVVVNGFPQASSWTEAAITAICGDIDTCIPPKTCLLSVDTLEPGPEHLVHCGSRLLSLRLLLLHANRRAPCPGCTTYASQVDTLGQTRRSRCKGYHPPIRGPCGSKPPTPLPPLHPQARRHTQTGTVVRGHTRRRPVEASATILLLAHGWSRGLLDASTPPPPSLTAVLLVEGRLEQRLHGPHLAEVLLLRRLAQQSTSARLHSNTTDAAAASCASAAAD